MVTATAKSITPIDLPDLIYNLNRMADILKERKTLYAITVSKKLFNDMKNRFSDKRTEHKKIDDIGISPMALTGIKVFIKKYQRDIKHFYSQKELMEYMKQQ